MTLSVRTPPFYNLIAEFRFVRGILAKLTYSTLTDICFSNRSCRFVINIGALAGVRCGQLLVQFTVIMLRCTGPGATKWVLQFMGLLVGNLCISTIPDLRATIGRKCVVIVPVLLNGAVLHSTTLGCI